jgi:hypothetical protein
MSIPSIGPVLTPASFQIQSAQAQVILTWSYVPLATIYYISRSTDGINFTQLGQTPLLTYSDTTGTAGTIYYYYVQAGATINSIPYSSLATQILAGVPLLPGQTTVGNLVLECRQRVNKENSNFYTSQEMVSMISQSYKELYDKIITAYGDDYYLATPYTWTTIQNQQLYPLPNDFYKSLLVEVALNPQDPNSYVTIKQFMLRQKNLFNYPNQYTMYGITNIRYRLEGNNLFIVPQTQGAQTLRMWYAPRPSQLIFLTDLVDGVSGWEEYIVADVCIKMLAKEESDVSVFAAQKKDMDKRLDEMAKNRNIGEPQTVTDAKYLNFSWGDPNDGWNSGGNGMA